MDWFRLKFIKWARMAQSPDLNPILNLLQVKISGCFLCSLTLLKLFSEEHWPKDLYLCDFLFIKKLTNHVSLLIYKPCTSLC